MLTSKTFQAGILLAGFAFTTAAPAARADEIEQATRIVNVGNLDLRTEAGAATLRHRVRSAARHVCGDAGPFGTPDNQSYNECVERAEQQAMLRSDALIASARTDVHLALAN